MFKASSAHQGCRMKVHFIFSCTKDDKTGGGYGLVREHDVLHRYAAHTMCDCHTSKVEILN